MGEGLNQVILIGNLGMDPELKYTQGGGAVLRLRIATTESYVDKNRQRQEKTEWHTVVVWGNRAEALNKILAKNTGQTLKKIEVDVDRDYYMLAEESKAYGLVDKVLR